MSDLSKIWSKTTKKIFVETFTEQTQTENLNSQQFNLAIITQFFPPDYAATGQLIQELANHLGKKNIQVNIFTGQPGYAFKQKKASALETATNIRIQRSQVKQLCSKRIRSKTLNGIIFTLMAGWHLLRNARKNDAIILTTAPPFLAIVGYLASLIVKLDYICLVYDLYPDVVIELGIISQHNLIAKLWNKINAIIWHRSKKIVVLSNTMKQRIADQHPEVATKISVIHNWADATWIKPLDKADNWFAHQHQLNHKFTILYSGNLGHCHDLDTIMDTAILLKEQPIQFVFIGAGAKHQQCLQTAKELNLNNCIFLPYQDRENLPYSLTACDLALVSIAPGLEGVIAPSKVYGIMAAGKAIAAICEPHSYLRQLIDKANCGASFNNNHSEDLAAFILSLESNSAITHEMGQAGRSYLKKHFTPEIIAQQYCQVLGVDVDAQELKLDREHILYGIIESR